MTELQERRPIGACDWCVAAGSALTAVVTSRFTDSYFPSMHQVVVFAHRHGLV